MSNRSELVAFVVERLHAIQTVDGFTTDAGNALFIGEIPELGPDDPTSGIAVMLGDDMPRYQGEQILLRLPVLIAALAKADLDDAWGTVEGLLADIKQAMELPDRWFEKRLKAPLTRGATRTIVRQAGSTTIGVHVTYILDYAEVWGTP